MAILMPGRRPAPSYNEPANFADILAQIISPETILQSLGAGGGGGPEQYLASAQALAQQLGMGGGGGGGGSNMMQAAMQAINQGYAPEIAGIRREIAGSRAQEAQDVADINSWYGQLGGQYRSAADEAARGGKRAAKATRKEARTAMEGFGGPGAGLLARDAASAAGSERAMGRAEAGMNRTLASNTMNQADYASLVRERLHAGERQDMIAALNELRSKKASAKSSARLSVQQQRQAQEADQFGQMMQLAQFLASNAQQNNPLEQIGGAMGLLGKGGEMGLPGFEQYAPEPNVDPTQMFQLFSGMVNPEDDLEDNQKRLAAAAAAFGLPADDQSSAMMNLALLMAGQDPNNPGGKDSDFIPDFLNLRNIASVVSPGYGAYRGGKKLLEKLF